MQRLLRTGTLITLILFMNCIISGCADDPTEAVDEIAQVNLIATIPEDGGTISGAGELKMFFDSFPTSVTVDGKPAVILYNTATMQITDLPNVSPGTEKTVTVKWRNQENFLAGSKTITFTVLKQVTVQAYPAPGSTILPGTYIGLTFNEEVEAVTVNGTPATRDGRSRLEWGAQPDLALGPVTLIVEWKSQDGSTGTILLDDYEVSTRNGGSPPAIVGGTVDYSATDIDPAVINAGGIRYDFDEPVTGTIKLTDEVGADLNWIGNVQGYSATLTSVKGQELVYDTAYTIEIDVSDGGNNRLQTTITFVTKHVEVDYAAEETAIIEIFALHAEAIGTKDPDEFMPYWLKDESDDVFVVWTFWGGGFEKHLGWKAIKSGWTDMFRLHEGKMRVEIESVAIDKDAKNATLRGRYQWARNGRLVAWMIKQNRKDGWKIKQVDYTDGKFGKQVDELEDPAYVNPPRAGKQK